VCIDVPFFEWPATEARGGPRRRRTASYCGAPIRCSAIAHFLARQAKEAPISFRDFATRWLRTEVVLPCERNVEGALAPNSVRQRENTLRIYLIPFFGAMDVRRIRLRDVQRFVDERVEAGQPRSPRTLEIVLGTLRGILLHAQAQELV
jgi:hypothetical protein